MSKIGEIRRRVGQRIAGSALPTYRVPAHLQPDGTITYNREDLAGCATKEVPATPRLRLGQWIAGRHEPTGDGIWAYPPGPDRGEGPSLYAVISYYFTRDGYRGKRTAGVTVPISDQTPPTVHDIINALRKFSETGETKIISAETLSGKPYPLPNRQTACPQPN